MIYNSINKNLDELIYLLNQLSSQTFSQSCNSLSNASIGEHIRHILEMFECLEQSYDSGILNYDDRKRNKNIQTDTLYAKQFIVTIKKSLKKEDKPIFLQQVIDGKSVEIKSTYKRELLYNLEHCIHHQALIRVAIVEYGNVLINDDFGVARSTIEYRNKCVQ